MNPGTTRETGFTRRWSIGILIKGKEEVLKIVLNGRVTTGGLVS